MPDEPISTIPKANILDATPHELECFMMNIGQSPYRARQLWQWLWQRDAQNFEIMGNLPKNMRYALEEQYEIRWPKIVERAVSRDGTSKFLLEMADGARIETVYLEERDHATLCLSTQTGCAMGCRFCATGHLGAGRNLTPGEITGQVLIGRQHAQSVGRQTVRNLVFMGMGEPLLNLENLTEALACLHHPQGLDISGRRMTVSTCGLPKPMAAFGRLGLGSLAVSLHAPNQELREQIMPGAAKVHLDDLLDACKAYPLKPRERITFEYVLLAGINDSLEHARQLVRILSHVKGKVNLISCNPSPNSPYQPSSLAVAEAFQQVLWDKEIVVTLRKSKGADIAAACGQLARTEITGTGASLDNGSVPL